MKKYAHSDIYILYHRVPLTLVVKCNVLLRGGWGFPSFTDFLS